MKKYLVLFTFLLSGVVRAYPPVDSLGIEKKDGKRFILHRVDEGQTLFAIARRYGRSVADIKAANPDMKEAVQYAQIVRVPIPDGALSRKEARTIDKAIRKQEKVEKVQERTAKTTPDKAGPPPAKQAAKETRPADDPAKAGIHVVEPGQTLYSLAIRYGVAQADLRKWNNLPSDNVLIGQALIVSEKAYQARIPASSTPSVAAKTAPPAHPDTPARNQPKVEHPVAKRPDEANTPKPDSPPAKSDNPTTTKPDEVVVETPRPGNDAPMPTRGRRIATSGVAEMIDGDGSGKYLALHRTAPIGTLVQVRNEFNNQSLWVKVIGRLPDTGVNDKILIKLSAQAFAKLSPEDRRFRAEVSYIAP